MVWSRSGIPIEFHQTCLLMSQSHICFLSVLLPYICGVWLVLPLERVLVLFVLLCSFIGLLIFFPFGTNLHVVVIAAFCWAIWKTRNRACFDICAHFYVTV